MARLRRSWSGDQCPERRAGLRHVREDAPECVFCGAFLTSKRLPSPQHARPIEFTDKQVADLEFLRWLYRERRV